MQLSDFDVADGKCRVVMFCHDQHLDRRVIAQAKSLTDNNCKVSLIALSYTSDDSKEVTHEQIRLIRVGLGRIVPANSTYASYQARRKWLNARYDMTRGLGGIFVKSIRKLIHAANGANYLFYRIALLARYKNLHLSDPLPFTSALLHAARNLSVDLVQVHDLPALEAGVQFAESRNVPLIYDAHELYPEQRSFSSTQIRECADAEARLIKHADLVFSVNESIGQELSKRYGIPSPVTLLNALDPPAEFDPAKRYDLLREKIGIAPDRKILLFQGGFSPNRNLRELVVAMSMVKNPSITLVLMGFGDYKKTLEKKANKLGLSNKNVFFLDAVSPEELIQHSASADMGIIPYPHVDLNSYYCTPNKLFEFIQAGLPILANDSPELRRFVENTGFGMVAPTNTASDLATAIDTAFASDKYVQWKENLKAKRNEFSWQQESQNYLNAIRPFL